MHGLQTQKEPDLQEDSPTWGWVQTASDVHNPCYDSPTSMQAPDLTGNSCVRGPGRVVSIPRMAHRFGIESPRLATTGLGKAPVERHFKSEPLTLPLTYIHRGDLGSKTARMRSRSDFLLRGNKLVWVCPARSKFVWQSGPFFRPGNPANGTLGILSCPLFSFNQFFCHNHASEKVET